MLNLQSVFEHTPPPPPIFRIKISKTPTYKLLCTYKVSVQEQHIFSV